MGLSRNLLVLIVAGAMLSPLGAHAAGSEKKKSGGVSYVQLPALTATIRHADGRRGVLSVEAGLDVPDARLRERAQKSQPLLRDAYLRWLTIYAAALPAEAPPNAEQIGGELQRATDRVLGRGGATLLIGTVLAN